MEISAMKALLLGATLVLAASPAYSGNIYGPNGKPIGHIVYNADGSTTNSIGERTIGTSSGYQSYANGRMTRYGVWQAGGMRHYSADGRYLGLTVRRGRTLTNYNADGSFRSTSISRYR
jgi:hypothetical protein